MVTEVTLSEDTTEVAKVVTNGLRGLSPYVYKRSSFAPASS